MSCLNCGQDIPPHRHGNSLYCSEDCMYDAKKQTSFLAYHAKADLHKEYKRNRDLLAKYYQFQEKGYEIRYEHLVKEDFNFGFSTDETLGPSGQVCKVIGDHAYYLETKTQKITLWYLTFNQSQTA